MKVSILVILCFLTMLTQAQLQREPDVDSLKRVTFKLVAPGANEIKLINLSDEMALGAKEYAFKKDSEGLWIVTTKPCRPGLHYYELNIDGAKVSDPSSKMYFGWAKWTGMVEVPDDKLDFYLPKNVLHGEVRQHYYYSTITQNTRKCLVYTPPGYSSSNKNYPVLYLQHGSGESELGWTMQGKVNLIMDNLQAEGKIIPFIIVMDNGYAPRPGAENQFNPGGADNLFADLLTTELVPMIDASYRTYKNKENRAIAGLSMGGNQAIQIGFDHPELFGAIATFSGPGRSIFHAEETKKKLLDNPDKFNRLYRLFFVGCGSLESYYPEMKEMYETLKKRKMNTAFSSPVGSHEWQVWRVNFYDFAQMVFK